MARRYEEEVHPPLTPASPPSAMTHRHAVSPAILPNHPDFLLTMGTTSDKQQLALSHVMQACEQKLAAAAEAHVCHCDDPDHRKLLDEMLNWVKEEWKSDFKNGVAISGVVDGFHQKLKLMKRNVARNPGIGIQCQLSNSEYVSLKDPLSHIQAELPIASVCPDCVLNWYTSDAKFINPCPEPHVAVWAKQGGFSFWPAKLMSLSPADQTDRKAFVWFFGPQNQTADLPLRRIRFVSQESIYDMAKKNFRGNLRRDYYKAIKSLCKYLSNVKASNPLLQVYWPDSQTHYDGRTITYQIQSPDHPAVMAHTPGSDYDMFAETIFSATSPTPVPSHHLNRLLADKRWKDGIAIEITAISPVPLRSAAGSKFDDGDETEIDSQAEDADDSHFSDETEIDTDADHSVAPPEHQPQQSPADLMKQQIRQRLADGKQKQKEEFEKEKMLLEQQFAAELSELQKQFDEMDRPLLLAAGRRVQ